MSTEPHLRVLVTTLSKRFVDKGLIIEAGWVAFSEITIPKDASSAQMNDMRTAFYAGAQHLFGSIMTILDPGDEPTDADLARMDQIDRELREFYEYMKLKYDAPKGRS